MERQDESLAEQVEHRHANDVELEDDCQLEYESVWRDMVSYAVLRNNLRKVSRDNSYLDHVLRESRKNYLSSHSKL